VTTVQVLPAVWPSMAYAAAEDLLARFVDRITIDGRPVARAEVVLGDPAPLDCCGYAYSTVRRLFLSSAFPLDDTFAAGLAFDPVRCMTGTPACTLDVGVFRCMPSLTDAGGWPSPGDHSLATSALYADAEALVEALSCQTDFGVSPVAVTFVSPLGGCGSVFGSVTVDLDPVVG